MSEQGQNPPAGWYPDPENPGQQRYWDGGHWAAPQASPTASIPTPGSQTEVMPAGPPVAGETVPAGAPLLSDQAVSGAGGGRGKAIAIVAVIAAVALIGGGAWALTRDSGGTDVLPPREFARAVSDICDEVDDVFDRDPDDDEIAAVSESALGKLVKEFRSIAPEDAVDQWKDAVNDLEAAGSDGLSSSRDFDRVGREFDRIERRFGVDCVDAGRKGSGRNIPGLDDDFGSDDFGLDDFGFDDFGLDDLDFDDFFDGFEQFGDLFGDLDFGDLEDLFGQFEDFFGDFDLEEMFGN